jgi:hypothetical protein
LALWRWATATAMWGLSPPALNGRGTKGRGSSISYA